MEKSKREIILAAALQMFVEHGFESSPTSKIAKKAGVATGTLFHYFKTKEELINELYLEVKIDMVNAIKQNLSEAKTIRQKVESLWYNGISWSLANPAGNKFFAMYGISSYISSNTREVGFRQFDFVLDILAQGIKEEILKDLPIEMMTEVCFGLINGSVNYFNTHKDEFADEKCRERSFSMFWDSIKR